MTVNGKDITTILNQLSKPGKKDKDYSGKDYIKIEHYYARMNEVVGVDHYNVSFSDETFRTVMSGQELISVKCTIEILDDDYNVILKKEGYGATELKYTKETGKSDGLKNIPTIACSSAFKEACKTLGIFGLRPTGFSDDDSVSADSVKSEDKPKKASAKKSTVAEESKGKSYSLSTISPAEEVRQDRTGKTVYRLKCTEGGTDRRIDVIVYPNNYTSCEEKVMQMVNLMSERKLSVNLICDSLTTPKDGVEQVVFKQFA